MSRVKALLLIVIVTVLFAAGCDAATNDDSVFGNIVYRERIALPPDAVVTVRIQNVSLMDAPPEQTIIGEKIIAEPGQVPIPYEVFYDPADVDERATYSIIARIEDSDGNLLFINTQPVPVITNGNPTEDVEVLVEKVGTTAEAAMDSVSGTVFYRERIALGPEAVLVVRIQNESLMDAPPEKTIIAEEIIANPGQVPIPYEVFYDPADVDPRAVYGVRARIEDGSGSLLFINTQQVAVITHDNPTDDVEVLVQFVGAAANPTPAPVEATPAPTLPPAIITAAAATIEAYLATPTATPGQAPGDTSELVNATVAPDQAPVIINFFASDVPEDPAVSFNLNWDTQNATRVEIFGHVMDNPQTGSWPIYGATTNHWVLWAANDVAWVESVLTVQPDHDLGTALSPVNVNSRLVNISVRDPQFVDSDNINLIVNGIPLLQNYTLDGRFVTVPATLNPGQNQVQINLVDEGTTPTAVVEVQITNVASGSAGQFSRALRAGETETLTINAP
jgi:uncharacterized lipoprotein YbaY